MGLTGPNFDSVDDNFAANLRVRREAADLSQEELAQRMTDLGFGFSQATIWKIEQGKRPVKLSEAVALGEALQLADVRQGGWQRLLETPHDRQYKDAAQACHVAAGQAYAALMDAATAYIQTQVDLAATIGLAQEAGVAIPEWWTTYLNDPAERAVIDARIRGDLADQHQFEIADEIGKVMAALRENGYEPLFRPEDLEHVGPALPTSEAHGDTGEGATS